MINAVKSLHDRGIVHPELQAHHFLYASDGSIKVAGFAPTGYALPVRNVNDITTRKEADMLQVVNIVKGLISIAQPADQALPVTALVHTLLLGGVECPEEDAELVRKTSLALGGQ